ncbi:hypothetical protein EGW08_005267 [Elysia chlorotica]|uniref:N-acetyltransferase domain-containing protein n=1 Tax=Elysia chlorotica TaxID=188477 RepID=A0A433TZE0_ELYCH|nr:hypothetical protein EGW08_005267 [Elysia chlorotica]
MADDGGIQALNTNTDMQSGQETQSGNEDIDCFGRPGSQIDEKIEFKNQFGESVYAVPVIVDFKRVMQLGQVSSSEGVIAGISNRDLLHAVVGLYDISLSDMESETIYTTVCARWARTIVLVQDLKDAVDVLTERNVKQKSKSKKEDKPKSEEEQQTDWRSRINENDNILKEDEAVISAFVEAFSDTEEEDEEGEEEDEEEEENFSKGIHTFISNTIERRKQRQSCSGVIQPSMVGIENRLLGCATFERKFVAHKERVIHLTLISVRPRYRKFRVGGYLLSKCVSPSVVGNYDAVVVHADNSAVDFFKKFGFSDDVILNSKWSDLADAFTNCTLMSYLPGFSGHSLLSSSVSKEKDPDVYEIDQELRVWQTKSKEAYQGQLCCAMKFRNEILQLKYLVKSQNELLNKLVSDNDKVRREKLQVGELSLKEREQSGLLFYCVLRWVYRVLNNQAKDPDKGIIAVKKIFLRKPQTTITRQEIQWNSEGKTEPPPPRPPPVEKPSAPFTAESNSDIITRFTQGMEADRSINVRYSVTSISKAPDNPTMRTRFKASLDSLQDPDMVTELYYAGSLEKPSRLGQILADGFSKEDFTHGEFGRGLYFTKYPSKAAQFSALGKLLEVRVGLGRVETVMKYDRTRKEPSKGHDAVISPGRLYRPGDQGEAAMLCQEYVLFDCDQVLPLCIITYSANPSM